MRYIYTDTYIYIYLQRERERGEREIVYLEAEADSSSSQFLMCLTFRLKMAADCRTSDLRRRTTALTPATVRIKLVKAIDEELRILIWFSRVFQGFHSERRLCFFGQGLRWIKFIYGPRPKYLYLLWAFSFLWSPRLRQYPFLGSNLSQFRSPSCSIFFFFLK